jgi:cyclopropane fatty-acyl-phospholipid synthase-like methyltransferase
MQKWLKPQHGEKSLDIASGGGFLTLPVAQWTQAVTYAVDNSISQLNALKRKALNYPIKVVLDNFSDLKSISSFGSDIGTIDFATSFGGIHHIINTKDSEGKLQNNQHNMMITVDKLLRPGGRFIAADVSSNTSLAKHFDESVKNNCITGHQEKWISIDRLENELIQGTGMKLIKAEIINTGMIFESTHQMGMYMKCLHALDQPENTILEELQDILGYSENNGMFFLNWPLLFFHLQKIS